MIVLFYFFATLLVFLRLLLGPTFADRLLSLDILSNIVVLGTVVYAIETKSMIYMDVAIAFVVVSFTSVLATAKWVRKK